MDLNKGGKKVLIIKGNRAVTDSSDTDTFKLL